jgi:hypothetical protein
MEDNEMDSKERERKLALRARKRLERERQSNEKMRLERKKDKERKKGKRAHLTKENEVSHQIVSKQAHLETDNESDFEDEKVTDGQSKKRDIRNMNDEEKKAYQRERKKKSRENLKKPYIGGKNPRWLQLKAAKEKYRSKKYNIGVVKYRKELDEAGKVQLFGETFKKVDLKINGQFLEVDRVFPLRKFDLQCIEMLYKDYSQLIDLLASLGHQWTSSGDKN